MSSLPYIIENGLRRVIPYYQSFKTHIKTRWEGRTILDVFSNELGQEPEVIRKEIEANKIYILQNFGKKNDSSYVKGWESLKDRLIKKHDVIYNMRHMHEPSVVVDESIEANTPKTMINIVHHDHDFLVINKPAGIPVHPTLNYHYNSVSEILKHDLNLENIWTTHRLDKVTSGILILGLNKETGSKVANIIEHKLESTFKTYLARVKGHFPDLYSYTCPIFLVNPNGGYLMPSNLNKLPVKSTTKFERLRYNNELDESIVECIPISGKMHQIRIHLRNIGYPIVNDWVYNDKSNLSTINILKNDIELGLYDKIIEKHPNFLQDLEFIDLNSLIDDKIKEKLVNIKHLATERLDNYRTSVCDECGRTLFEMERNKEHSFIYLHAFRYKYEGGSDSFDFKTPMPVWCEI